MPFSYLHAADLHLDTPFTSVSGYPERVGAALREASLEAWDALISTAINRQVAFVVLAGDIYDGAERGIRAQRAFLDGVTRLAEHGIRTFLVHGNHDPVTEGWTAITSFPAEVHRFSETQVESISFEAGGEQVVVHGTSYAVSATTDNLALQFPSASPGAFNIGLLHANLSGLGSKHQDYSPCSLDDLRRTGYQYWALGHIHQRQTPHAGHPWIVYPGNIQGRTPRSSERGAKGAVIVAVTNGVAAEPEFVALDRVRFVDIAVAIDDVIDTGVLLDRLEAAADPARHGGRGVLVRATVEGSGRLHHELITQARRDEILRDLRDRGAGAAPFAWWERITWKTRSSVDVIDIRRREDFASDLLRFMDEAAPAVTAGWIDELPSDVVRELGELLPAADAPAIWEAAQRLALESVTALEP
ncbi:metallophosphoesterase family protein [Aquihabitans sp. McL0605]|uniref:metallophosphoesterase family protein n=1 Tax=Aquihabitans sp. McL0605 TaxID=3415671 RepID=UPI003CE74A92